MKKLLLSCLIIVLMLTIRVNSDDIDCPPYVAINPNDPTCLTCQECTKCKGKDLAGPPPKKEYDDPLECTQCTAGKVKQESLGCKIRCGAAGKCRECEKGYYLDGGSHPDYDSCKPCTMVGCTGNCASESLCYSCDEGYYVSKFRRRVDPGNDVPPRLLVGEIEECSKFPTENVKEVESGASITDNYILCNEGYYRSTSDFDDYLQLTKGELVTQTLSCTKCFDHCKRCFSADSCSRCDPGYFISDERNGCVVCVENCKECLNVTTCEECKEGFYMDDEGKCVACDSTVKNCELCDEGDICLLCKEGYALINSGNCSLITEVCKMD